MKGFFIGIALTLLMLICGIPSLHTEETDRPPKPPEGCMKPPPEAVAACKGKSEGAVVQFTTSRGDILKGICKKSDGQLAAFPERHGQPPPPPPEAFAACKGKTEGAVVQFTTSRGDTLKGVCKKFESKLAAFPERHGQPPPPPPYDDCSRQPSK
jgi:hypothetical protein